MPNHSKKLVPTNKEISYHQQELDDWCGAACAQMVLHSLDFDAPFINQEPLIKAMQARRGCREEEIEWAAAPDRLTKVLNASTGPPPLEQFHLVRADSASSITRRIIWNIEEFGRPAIALVYGFRHWVVVRGFTASRRPTGPDDDSYNILALNIYDPSPAMPHDRPGTPGWPPEHRPDDECVLEAPHGNGVLHVSYELWAGPPEVTNPGAEDEDTYYMTGIGPVESTWKNKFLAICVALDNEDPADVGCGEVTEAMDALGIEKREAAVNRKDRTTGGVGRAGKRDKELDDKANDTELDYDPVRAALNILYDYGLRDDDEFRDVIKGVEPGKPWRVQYIGSPGSSYVVVPFSNAHATPLLVCLDAKTGNYLQATAASNPRLDVYPMLDSDTVKATLLKTPLRIDNRSILVDREQLPEGDLPLVWKPCMESFTPFVPFYLVTLKMAQFSVRVYIRASDGFVCTELTDKLGGV